MEFEYIDCEWCGSSKSTLLFTGEDRLLRLPGEFSVSRCNNCGLLRQNPRPTFKAMENFYTETYTAYEPIIKNENSKLRLFDRRYGMSKRINAIRKYKPEGYLLDVGCGTGIFLGEITRFPNWISCGIEPNEKAALYAKENLDVEIINQPFTETELNVNHYDIITLWNVLEHVYFPLKNLRYAYQLLKEDGLLVMSIPNLESFDALLFGKKWVGWDLPRHLYWFSQNQLDQILSEIGFEIVEKRCIAGSHAAFSLNIEFLLSDKTFTKIHLNNIIKSIFNSNLSRVFFSLPFWILGKMNLCTILTVFAKKK